MGADANAQRFSLPLFSILLYLPFALINNTNLALAIWMMVLEVGLIAIFLMSMKLFFWKPRSIVLGGLLLFGLFGFHGIMPLLAGNLIILTTLVVIVILMAVQDKHDEIAGILLTFLLFNPEPVAFFVVFLVVWAIYSQRTKIIVWFLGSFLLLIGFSIALIPDWGLQYLRNFLIAYQAIEPGSPGGVLISRWGEIGNRLSIGITAFIVVFILVEWWLLYRSGSKRLFIWTGMTTLVLGTWSGLKISPLHYVILYPAIIMGLQLLSERWKERANGLILSILALLFLTNWGIFLATISENLQIGISSFLFFPTPVVAFLLLYWSRWWVVKSRKVEMGPTLIEIKDS